ncbi:MAG: homoserine kinase [Chloroflexi bacterium]|nr:homoserine kinase [Chloroflexota bacterium]
MTKIQVRVPATTANLGPGFDAIGLALDLWNTAEFSIDGEGTRVEVEGEGDKVLPRNGSNLIVQAALRVYENAGQEKPSNLLIKCRNGIPLGSGLGSSAAAVLAGLLGSNALLGKPLSAEKILALALELEGHADNVAAALYGRLVLVVQDGEDIITHQIKVLGWKVVVVIPSISLPTEEARQRLPDMYARADVVFNLGRSAMVVAAFRAGDANLLARVMDDKLHQPYRVPLIPGARQAIEAAQQIGAAAALSGAGPGVAAFVRNGGEEVGEVMQAAFEEKGVESRRFILGVVDEGAEVTG